MELSVLKATKILLKLNQQHGEVLTRLSSMKRRHSGLRAISVGEAAGGGTPHSSSTQRNFCGHVEDRRLVWTANAIVVSQGWKPCHLLPGLIFFS